MTARTAGASHIRRTWSEFRRQAKPVVAQFEAGLAEPRATQTKRLLALVRQNAQSAYGSEHGFASIDSFDTFRERVPVSRWADVEPWVARACGERSGVLTTEQPLFFERTSGSSRATKLIPYTKTLLREFQQAIVVWLARLYDEWPAVANGPGYWAVSPAVATPQVAANGIAIGCVSDAGYLADSCAERLLATVLDTAGIAQADDWRLATLASMIDAPDLAMISVWSPTFLSAMLRLLQAGPDSDANLDYLLHQTSPGRRAALREAVAANDPGALWPALSVISCWTDGPSAAYARQLQEYFPQACLSPKGLLATEGVVSLPFGRSGQCPLAIDSHVLEFMDEQERLLLADEIVAGARYQPLITTGGGLYRYCLGDVVEVTGFLERTPCIRFVGRGDRSDLVGEKLDGMLVANACRAAVGHANGITLMPVPDANPPHYQLLVDAAADSYKIAIASAVELELQKVYHYARARQLGQLGPVSTHVIPGAPELIYRAWEAMGLRAGDAKVSSLITSLPFARAIMTAVADADRCSE